MEYSAQLFDPSTIAGLTDSLATALRHVTAQPHTPIAAVPLLDVAGASSLLSRFCYSELRPEYLAGPLAHQLFEAAAAASPRTACLVFEGEVLRYQQVREMGPGSLVIVYPAGKLSFAPNEPPAVLSYPSPSHPTPPLKKLFILARNPQVNQRANQLAHALIAQGVQPDVPVGLLLDRSPDFVIAVLAVLKVGYISCSPSIMGASECLTESRAAGPCWIVWFIVLAGELSCAVVWCAGRRLLPAAGPFLPRGAAGGLCGGRLPGPAAGARSACGTGRAAGQGSGAAPTKCGANSGAAPCRDGS